MNKDSLFEHKLEKAIKNLPAHEHEDMIWERIEAQLAFEEKLGIATNNLPEFDFEPGNWGKIEQKLLENKKPVKKLKLRKLVVYSLSAAAAIALIIGLSGVLTKNDNAIITYTKEQVAENESSQIEKTEELDPMKFLEQSCMSKSEICNSPEFKEQKETLKELEAERQRITETIDAYGESPELVKSLIKIENLKSEILKDLIKTLNS